MRKLKFLLLACFTWNCTPQNAPIGTQEPSQYAHGQVPYQRIVDGKNEPNHWMTHSGNYAAHRYSPLTEIDTSNVANLRMKWQYQVQRSGLIETTPLVVDDVMYITEPPSTVSALDIHTGRRLWTWIPHLLNSRS